MGDRIGDAIDGNDLDELLRIVDGLCDAREWDALVSLRDRARRAFERGRQLWPAASRAEYRLALDAPASYAAAVLTEDAGRFAFGPLPEVVASTHTWADLAPHVTAGPAAALAAHERVVRGEVIDANAVVHAEVLSVPLHLESWEPEYYLATYWPDRVEVADPEPVRGRPLSFPRDAPRRVDDDDVTHTLRDVVHTWTARSEGVARVACVEGTAEAADRGARRYRGRGTRRRSRRRRGARAYCVGGVQWRAPRPASRRRRRPRPCVGRGRRAGRISVWGESGSRGARRRSIGVALVGVERARRLHRLGVAYRGRGCDRRHRVGVRRRRPRASSASA